MNLPNMKKNDAAELLIAIKIKDCMLTDQATVICELREKITDLELHNTNYEEKKIELLDIIEVHKEEKNNLFEKLDKKIIKEKKLKLRINELQIENDKLRDELDLDLDTESESDTQSNCNSNIDSDDEDNGHEVYLNKKNEINRDNNYENDDDNEDEDEDRYDEKNNSDDDDDGDNSGSNNNSNNNNGNNEIKKKKINNREVNEKIVKDGRNSRIGSKVTDFLGIAEVSRHRNQDPQFQFSKYVKNDLKTQKKSERNSKDLKRNETIKNEKRQRKKLQLLSRKELKNIITKLEKELNDNEIINLSKLNDEKENIEKDKEKNLSLIEKLKLEFSEMLLEGKEVKKEKEFAEKELLKKEKEGLRVAQNMVNFYFHV